jgi:hypothetical protein
MRCTTIDGANQRPERVVNHNRLRRGRLTYLAATVATIAIGLLVHLGGARLGPVVRDVLGDALWAAMIVWLTGALAPSARLAVRAVVAYAVCAAVEASQMYHTSAIDAIRATQIGHLFLGSGFDPRDLLAYALGVAGAVLLEVAVVARVARVARSLRPSSDEL